MKVEQLTCAIGAELSGVSLADAARDDALFAEIKAALLQQLPLFMAAVLVLNATPGVDLLLTVSRTAQLGMRAGFMAALGINVGDFVAIDSLPIVGDNGSVNARHLDGKAGVATALAVTTAQRTPAAPELPTIAEAGVPGFESASWQMLVAPGHTAASEVLGDHAAV